MNDLVLTVDGGSNLINSGVTIEQLNNSSTYRINGLNSLQTQEGTYNFTINGSGIEDKAGNPVSNNITETWVIDKTPPSPATDIQISSDFGTSNNDKRTNTTNFNISGSLGETGLTVFLKNKTTNQDLGQATVTDTTFNLEVELSSAGNHQIEVQLVDAAGNTTTSDFEVFADLIVPTVSQILNLPQQSVTTPIDFVDVVFSEAIDPSSFDHQDISLTRDGGQNLITDSVSIYAISETKYRIQGLTDLTTTPGSYRLVINTNNIDDTAGNSGNSLFENIFSIIEEPQPGIIITESGNITNVSETGSTDNYTVVLNTQPASQVTITINTDNQITTDKTTLTFNTDNWDTPQTVTVSAVNDAEGEELQQSIISHVVSSDDSNYDQISLGNITVNVEDNDAQIQGIAWNDQNGNAIQDTDEPGLEGWTIYLDDNNNGQLDTNETSTFTDANGNYNFTSLTPGNYTVAQVLQSGWQQTFPEVNITTTASDEKIYTPSEPEFTSSSLTTPADELINLDDFRSDTRFTDITGNGFATVIIDTGIDLDHPLFGADNDGDGIADRIVYQYDFADNDSDASDVNGHGSHVSSIVSGIASQTDIIALKVFKDNGSGYFSDLEESLQWVIDNAESYNIASVNLSLGDEQNWSSATSLYGIGDELAAIAGMGIIITSAAGNNFEKFGSQQGLAYPAIDPNTLAVGAVWANNDQIAEFSQRDENFTDIFAPGIPIPGADASGGNTTMEWHAR